MIISEKIRKLAFDKLPRALIIINPDGKVLFANSKTKKVLGYDTKFFVNNDFTKIIKPFKNHGDSKLIDAFERQVALTNQSEIFKIKNKSEIAIEYSFYPLVEKEKLRAYLLSIRRQSPAEYDQDLFIASLGHELKTPLAVLSSYTHLLEQAFIKKNYQQFKRYITIIEERTSNLIDLTNALLETISFGSGKMIFNDELIRIDAVVDDFVKQLQKTTSSHYLNYKSETKVKIKIDRDRLFQIVSNLINNAIKYSPKAKEIEIKVLKTEEYVQIQVKDTGFGISNKVASKIFKPFFREHRNKKQKLSGLGMGLFLTKQIVNHYGGDIYFITKKNEGSTFFVNLPI